MRFIVDHLEIIGPELAMVLLGLILWAIPATRATAHRAIRTGKTLARSSALPKWARGAFFLFTLPWPGPIDEIGAALLVLALWKMGHAETVRQAWHSSNPATLATLEA
jgi:hypothetical protein